MKFMRPSDPDKPPARRRSRGAARRSAAKKRQANGDKAQVPADPLLLSAPLAHWAGEPIARAGRKYALLGRVEALRLGPDGRCLEARVRGDRAAPYQIDVRVQDGSLDCHCTCEDETHRLCKHAVAALEVLRFPLPSIDESSASARRKQYAGRLGRGRGRIIQHAPLSAGFVVLGEMERTLTRDERVDLVREQEIQARKQRARRERAEVKKLRNGTRPPRFKVASGSDGVSYTVTLRGAKADLPSCSCPDFAKSELGTCKHIERARGWFSRRKKKLPTEVLSLWWRPRTWSDRVPDPLREIRVDLPIAELPRSLGRFFGADGCLREAGAADPVAFAREAIDTAARVARRRGWAWDLDAAVSRLLAGLESEASRRATLAVIEREGEIWNGIVPSLGFDLHRYQEHGALFLARRGRTFLADDMGLGKTIQAIVAALLMRAAAGAKRALVVCPASLKHQWRREIHKACGERATVVEGRRALRIAAYRQWTSGFLVLNYELVLRDLEAIRASRPDLVILDEAQRIKNWDTKTAKAVKLLDSPFAFILTGTPLENRLGELHSLVEFLHPRALGPRWRLLPFHSITDPQGRVLAYEGFDVLRKRLEAFFLRRERNEVLDQLPERTENIFWTEMLPSQRRPYRKLARKVATLITRKQPLRPNEVRALLQALTSMRILCNSLAQFSWNRCQERVLDGSPAAPADFKWIQSPKLEEFGHVLEDLLDESESKIVVFSQWERMLRVAHFVVRDLLDRRGERAEVFHGGLSGPARNHLLEAFRSDPELRVLFSTDAGGQGLNLQDAASVVVNLEVPWNPAVLEQRIGRVHRIGQRRSVQVLHFVTRDAIEERVRQVVESKRALFEGLLVDEVDQVVLDPKGRSSFVERVRELIDSERIDDLDPPL
jgi:superfamily II DNA or RNA helicase